MKAITLYQPWASAIAVGLKHFETRSWRTQYRGPLAIHAAKETPSRVIKAMGESNYLALQADVQIASPEEGFPALPTGCIVTTGILAACLYTTEPAIFRGFDAESERIDRAFGDFSPGRFAWRLDHVKINGFIPIPCRGAQGLWDVPQDIEALIRDQWTDEK